MRSHVARRNRGRRSGVAPIVAIATIIASGNTCLAQNTGDEPRRFELRIENGRLSDNAGTVSVRRDDAVDSARPCGGRAVSLPRRDPGALGRDDDAPKVLHGRGDGRKKADGGG